MADDSVFTELFGEKAKGDTSPNVPRPQSDDSYEILNQTRKLPDPSRETRKPVPPQ